MRFSPRSSLTPSRPRGFTLIELMITVAVVAVLAAVALPNYREHIVRSQLVDATNGLSTFRANMERHFQDNRTYATVGSFINPCGQTLAQRTVGNFVISCSAGPDANGFTLLATGSGSVAGFGFTINSSDLKATTAAPAGWTTCATQWMLKKGQVCS